MVVGQDIAIGADDYARAEALFPLLPRHAELSAAITLITAKELAEHRRDSVVPSLKTGLHHAGRSYGYHRGQYLLHHRGEADAARRRIRIRELERGRRGQQAIRTPHPERQQQGRGCSLGSNRNPLHLHVASKKSLSVTTGLPTIEWLHLYRWGNGVSGCHDKSVYAVPETWYVWRV